MRLRVDIVGTSRKRKNFLKYAVILLGLENHTDRMRLAYVIGFVQLPVAAALSKESERLRRQLRVGVGGRKRAS